MLTHTGENGASVPFVKLDLFKEAI